MGCCSDSGYTYCGQKFADKPYGTCVKRKRLDNGKLKDTNNSADDFVPEAKLSIK